MLLIDYTIVTHCSCLLQPHLTLTHSQLVQFVILFLPSGSESIGVISKLISHHSIHKLGWASNPCALSSTYEPDKPVDYWWLDSIVGNYVWVQQRSALTNYVDSALKEDKCFNFTEHCYSREILCGHLLQLYTNGLNAAPIH